MANAERIQIQDSQSNADPNPEQWKKRLATEKTIDQILWQFASYHV